MESKTFSTFIMNSAQELQEKELFADVYLQPAKVDIIAYNSCFRNKHKYEFSSILLTKQGFPAHKLLLAAVSPFFKLVLQEHYSDHRQTCVTVLLPETSAAAMHYVLLFIYGNRCDIPQHLYAEVLQLAKVLKIKSLLSILNPKSSSFKSSALETISALDFPAAAPFKNKKRGRKRNPPKFVNVTFDSTRNKKNYVHVTSASTLNAQRKLQNKYDSEMYEFSPISLRNQIFKSKDRINSVKCSQACTPSSPGPLSSLYSNAPEITKATCEVNASAKQNGAINNNSEFLDKLFANKSHSGANTFCTNATTNADAFLMDSDILQKKQDNKCVKLFIFTNNLNPLQGILGPQSSLNTIEHINESNLQGSVPLDRTLKALPSLYVPSIPGHLGSIPAISCSASSSNSFSVMASEVSKPALATVNNIPKNPFVTSSSRGKSIDNYEHHDTVEDMEDTHDEEEEEEKLKLQVLLKECETIDIGEVRNLENNLSSPEESQTTSLLSKENKFSISQWKSGVHKDTECKSVKNFKFVAKDKLNVKTHLKDVCKKMSLECKFCSKSFSTKNARTMHEKRHGTATLPCKVCNKKFKLKKDLMAHMMRHYGTKRFKCGECDKKLTTKKNLEMHILRMHKNINHFPRGLRDKSNGKGTSLKVHVNSAHDGERPCKCSKCRKIFTSPSLLHIHKSVYSRNYQFVCQVCKMAFKTHDTLVNHEKTHSTDKYCCPICKQQFRYQTALSEHKLVHSNFPVQALRCKICMKLFNNKRSYETHMLEIHNETVKVTKINVKQVNLPARSTAREDLRTNHVINNDNYITFKPLFISSANQKDILTNSNGTSRERQILQLKKYPVVYSKKCRPNLKLKVVRTFKHGDSSWVDLRKERSRSDFVTNNQEFIEVRNKTLDNTTDKEEVNVNNKNNQLMQIQNEKCVSYSHKLHTPRVSPCSMKGAKTIVSGNDDKSLMEKQNLTSLADIEPREKRHTNSIEFKLTEHINNFTYNDINMSMVTNGKPESSFNDIFSSKCLNESDNVAKFLFEEMSTFNESD